MNKDDVREQAAKLREKMTVKQKLAQIVGVFGGAPVPAEILYQFPDGVGEITFLPGTAAKEENLELLKKQQEIVMGKCGIPVLRHNEALTGQMTADSTVFPSAIGLAATWNTNVVREMGDIIRQQMVAEGTRHALSPVMDVARDPRWGRVGETYGEDPTICAAMSVAFVKGLQSDDLKNGVMATGKHFLGYALGEGGLNMSANPIPPRELREVYAKPFQAAITEADLAAVMNSYGVIDNELVIGSENILTKLLREEMGFDGVVVSDYMSINKMTELGCCGSPEQAGVEALKAGLDLELPMPYGYTEKMLPLLENDARAKEALERAVQKVLEAKIKLGLFENPYGRAEWMEDSYDRKKTGTVSLQAARESVVLLKNEGVLPLAKQKQKIALIGPHVNSIRLLFGCYTYPAAYERDTTGSMSDMPGLSGAQQGGENPYKMDYLPGSTVRASSPYIEEQLREHYRGRTLTIAEAIRETCEDAEIRSAKGCDVAGNDRSGFAEAMELAEWADIVIVTGGGKYGWGTNCTTGEGVDCDNIGLTGVQEELACRIADICGQEGKKSIFVHMDAKPLSSERIVGKYDAVLENWYPGDTGGKALAEILFGEYNPAGRLPMTAARNAGQIPVYASQRNGSGYRPAGMTIAKYVEGTAEPLFEFGCGLSYTTFEYSDMKVSGTVTADGEIEVSCMVKNTGNYDGEEVVQLYVRDELASMIRPAQELAGFYRVSLKAGEQKRVCFKMKTSQFAFLDKDMKWLVEAGEMTAMIGASSKDIRLRAGFTILDSAYVDGRTRGFYAHAGESSDDMPGKRRI